MSRIIDLIGSHILLYLSRIKYASRGIAEKALAQGIGRPVLMSFSNTIEANKKAYYDALEKSQSSNEITGWIDYFVKAALAAHNEAEQLIDFTLKKVKFFDRFKVLRYWIEFYQVLFLIQ